MTQTYISDISKHLGEQVTIKGWLYNKRSSGKLAFLEVRDGSGIIQGVVSKKDVSDQVWNDCEHLTQESALIVTGTPREHPWGTTNGDLKRRLEFSQEQYVEIDAFAREIGILWFASCWDEKSVA